MSTPDKTAILIERLIALTQKGRLQWTYLYPEQHSANVTLQSITLPQAYVLEDEDYGFGLVILQLSDPVNESEEPALLMHGARVEASPLDLGILRDEIRHFFEEVQLGETPTAHDRFHAAVQQATEPYQAELRRQQNNLAEERQFTKHHLNTIDRLSETVLNYSFLLDRIMGMQEAAAVADMAGRMGAEVPMNVEMLRTAVTFLMGEEKAQELSEDMYHQALGAAASKWMLNPQINLSSDPFNA